MLSVVELIEVSEDLEGDLQEILVLIFVISLFGSDT
jgi:hypothetical protein